MAGYVTWSKNTMAENSKAVSTLVMMTKPEAEKARDEINSSSGQYYATQRARVLDFYNREGWKALGYTSWIDCRDKEFAQGRSRIYQLLEEATIESELQGALGGKAPVLSGRALRALKDIRSEDRPEVASEAASEEDTGKPTGAGAVKRASSWKPSGAKKKAKKKEKALTIGEQAEDNEKLHQALMVIGDTCSRNFRKALEDGTVELTKAEVMAMSELEDERMQEAEKLISVNRWKLSRALKFLDQMPDESDTIETLCNLALASLDDEWTGDFGAFTITVKVHRRKLAKD